jgi:tricorn protease
MRLSRIVLAFMFALPATLYTPLSAAVNNAVNNTAAYFRYPALRGDTLIFTSEGDLWSSPANGGQARRLSTHPAEESRSAISHDGKLVAFSASYEGPLEAYVMPVSGGQPKRISFEGATAFVIGWTAQGEVLYSAQNRRGPNSQRVISAVHPQTLQRRVLPVAEAGEASLDESGQTLFFTRMGLILTNDNVKKYRGGAAARLWRFDLKTQAEAQPLSGTHQGNDKQPMWWQGRLYFISDRDGSDNIWSMQADGTNLIQHTRHQEWDVRNGALDQGRIVYQLGANLHRFDIAASQDQKLTIELASDYDQQRPRLLKKPLTFLTSAHFAPSGERVALTAHGQIALAGTGKLRRVEITLPTGSRARGATLSPDGKWVYAICDASGENEIWRFPADGSPGGIALTQGAMHRESLLLSPDGKMLAHTSKSGQLWLLNLSTLKNELIDTAPLEPEYGKLRWSPDSKLLAIVRPERALERMQIGLFDIASRRLHWLSSEKYHSHSPSFSPDGHWLYFLSDRHFQSSVGAPWGDRNTGPYFERRTQIYAYALRAERFPFQPKNELDTAVATAAVATSAATSEVQWPGLHERLFEVPLAPGNYGNLENDGKRLYFLDREAPGKSQLKTLTMDDSTTTPELFAADVREFALSANNKKLFFHKTSSEAAGDMFVVDAAPKAPTDLSKAIVVVNNWQLRINPAQEWPQLFNDAWRMHRDFLFDTQMRGVDWPAMRKKYAALLPQVHDRRELNDLLGMMSSELGTLHSQIVPGEIRLAEDGSIPAFLGGLFEREDDGFRVKHIYRTDDELPSERAPLAQPGVEVRVGDMILAVNGKLTKDVADISELLINQTGQQVLLKVRRTPTVQNTATKPATKPAQERNVIVTAVNNAQNARLRYADWEQGLRLQVEQQGKGRLGYLHLRAMGPQDIAQFTREFYANVTRDGLIIDVRRNNGGNIDSWIIEKLLRRVWSIWQLRNGAINTNMQQTFRGHLVVLADELTYSDGESFTAAVKALKLGSVVGKRTTGAGIFLSDGNALIDKGRARVAEEAVFSVPGAQWMVEGIGVVPDIEVDNLPHASFNGKDQQLETALNLLLEKLKTEPITPLKGGIIDPVGKR